MIKAFARTHAGPGSGGALAVHRHGEPLVDVWTGQSDSSGTPWDADTGAMIFSASKGITATVIHRIADRGLIDYDAPVAEYWPEFGANGKQRITVRHLLSHRAGLSSLRGLAGQGAEVLDHLLMEERLAAATPDRLLDKPIYHALTIGWLLAGLARAVTGQGMATLYRTEIAGPLGVDGIHLGAPPAGSRTRAADLTGSRSFIRALRRIQPLADRVTARPGPVTDPLRILYTPGIADMLEGDAPSILGGEMPAGNAVATASALATMYGALACGGVTADGKQFLSPGTVTALNRVQTFKIDRGLLLPLTWRLGYHGLPGPGALNGFGHIGAAGSFGWADPKSGISIALVQNRVDERWIAMDQIAAGWAVPLTMAAVRRAGDTGAQRGASAA
ncbi:serine hydrolase domain-containing protein [Nocardia sp. NPDC058058]|uniref:serine hydrolase domain-containing protein n=1 Tax=Nocardia sp. NPDC058058 TaxID=3346317 RepID=UPI0036DB6642